LCRRSAACHTSLNRFPLVTKSTLERHWARDFINIRKADGTHVSFEYLR
jgi:hypothetical protein